MGSTHISNTLYFIHWVHFFMIHWMNSLFYPGLKIHKKKRDMHFLEIPASSTSFTSSASLTSSTSSTSSASASHSDPP